MIFFLDKMKNETGVTNMDNVSMKLKIEENNKEIARLKRLRNGNMGPLNKMLGIFIAVTIVLVLAGAILLGVGAALPSVGLIAFGIILAILGIIFAGAGVGVTVKKKLQISAEKAAALDKIKQLEKENTLYQEEIDKNNK